VYVNAIFKRILGKNESVNMTYLRCSYGSIFNIPPFKKKKKINCVFPHKKTINIIIIIIIKIIFIKYKLIKKIFYYLLFIISIIIYYLILS